MNTAQVFRDYRQMTPASAPWAYNNMVYASGRRESEFTATSPLAPAPNPAWLYELVAHRKFFALDRTGWDEFAAAWDSGEADIPSVARSTNPIHAVCRALVAADPDLRARLEACDDWKEYAG